MSAKPIIPRERANRDIEEALDYYLGAGPEKIALGFIDDLERAYRHIAHHPATGSSRYAHELGLPNLRSRSLKRYPLVVFYMELDSHIEVWRVLHAERDIPTWMHELETGSR